MEYVKHLLDAHPLAQVAILASIIGPIIAILISGSKKPDQRQGNMGQGQRQRQQRNQ